MNLELSGWSQAMISGGRRRSDSLPVSERGADAQSETKRSSRVKGRRDARGGHEDRDTRNTVTGDFRFKFVGRPASRRHALLANKLQHYSFQPAIVTVRSIHLFIYLAEVYTHIEDGRVRRTEANANVMGTTGTRYDYGFQRDRKQEPRSVSATLTTYWSTAASYWLAVVSHYFKASRDTKTSWKERRESSTCRLWQCSLAATLSFEPSSRNLSFHLSPPRQASATAAPWSSRYFPSLHGTAQGKHEHISQICTQNIAWLALEDTQACTRWHNVHKKNTEKDRRPSPYRPNGPVINQRRVSNTFKRFDYTSGQRSSNARSCWERK
ncbi:hypothetical protein SCHPADRAFT_925635 [Schizopora paradoxa]|uniref:Uncharacterized protein n=1 Tax=Schizopora paradoxa TaxID=27342 RepID=A0A0H2S1M9_9AGAM|nr:hypothetical protein SCHPADRAFT_925635 [Schizopora paradoxa]